MSFLHRKGPLSLSASTARNQAPLLSNDALRNQIELLRQSSMMSPTSFSLDGAAAANFFQSKQAAMSSQPLPQSRQVTYDDMMYRNAALRRLTQIPAFVAHVDERHDAPALGSLALRNGQSILTNSAGKYRGLCVTWNVLLMPLLTLNSSHTGYGQVDMAILSQLERQSRMMQEVELNDMILRERHNQLLAAQSAGLRDARSQSMLEELLRQRAMPPSLDSIALHRLLQGQGQGQSSGLLQGNPAPAMLDNRGIDATSSLALPVGPFLCPGQPEVDDELYQQPMSQSEAFPYKLYRLIISMQKQGRSDVISFVPTGNAFCIHQPRVFLKEVAPLYFSCSKLSSFKRQLQLYGFTRVARVGEVAQRGVFVYSHPCFVEGRPDLLRNIQRLPKRSKAKAMALLRQNAEEHESDELSVASADDESKSEGKIKSV
jgi:HSF-type DNA-binding